MTWSVLQSAGANSGTPSVSVTMPSNCTSGTKLIAYVAAGVALGETVSGVQDGSGNQFTSLGFTQMAGTGFGKLYIWVADTPAGDVGTKPVITATASGSGDTVSLLVQEVSGLVTGTSPLDGTLGSVTGTGGTSTGSPTYSSTASGEFLVTVYGDNGGPSTWSSVSGWTTDANGVNGNSNDDIAVAYKNSTGGAESGGGWTLTSSGQEWSVIMAAFKLAAAATPSATPQPVVAPSLAAIQAACW